MVVHLPITLEVLLEKGKSLDLSSSKATCTQALHHGFSANLAGGTKSSWLPEAERLSA